MVTGVCRGHVFPVLTGRRRRAVRGRSVDPVPGQSAGDERRDRRHKRGASIAAGAARRLGYVARAGRSGAADMPITFEWRLEEPAGRRHAVDHRRNKGIVRRRRLCRDVPLTGPRSCAGSFYHRASRCRWAAGGGRLSAPGPVGDAVAASRILQPPQRL